MELVEKIVNTTINPDTGETVILDECNESEVKKSFDDMVNKINEGGDLFNDRPISETEVIDYLSNGSSDNVLLNELGSGTELEPQDIQKILKIANRRIKGEKFNVYKEFPDEAKKMVDDYVAGGIGLINSNGNSATYNSVRNSVAEALLDEFVDNIKIDRAKSDFAVEMQKVYESTSKELSDANLEFIEDRNKAYREAADKIEDETKREKLKSILDRIDEARALTELKEFAKVCKVKHIELDKPFTRIYTPFLSKYENSTNNIYDINLARKIVFRHLSKEGYTERDIDLFFIDFCKQTKNFSVDNPLEHAYMYYVLYYCAILDGDKNTTFKDNIKEVINNAKVRNNV